MPPGMQQALPLSRSVALRTRRSQACAKWVQCTGEGLWSSLGHCQPTHCGNASSYKPNRTLETGFPYRFFSILDVGHKFTLQRKNIR